MEQLILRRPRPVLDLFTTRSRSILLAKNIPTRRHESSFRRTKKALNIRPDPSFLSSNTNSSSNDHIIFNPPPSSTSVSHTPLKFLPPTDKRRQLLQAQAKSPAIRTQYQPYSQTNLPPLLKPNGPGYQRHHLTEADVAEIRRLRTSDPDTWSRLRLAKKFNCSPLFVSICCEAPAEKKAKEEARREAFMAKWGPKAKKAAADRAKRKELWYRDE